MRSKMRLILLCLLTLIGLAVAAQALFTGALLTSNNRHYPGQMMGGWGPHLRGLMRDGQGALWFAVDRGPGVYENYYIDYYKNVNNAWQLMATGTQYPGVEQNVASIIINGNEILSYGISVTTNYIEECYLVTTNIASKACNVVTTSGSPLVLPASSNYIGSAVDPSGTTRIVWWTTVGANGGGGTFSYIYNFGGGWNGPVTASLNGYNDLGYVTGILKDQSTFVGVGQLFLGSYPNGSYQATTLSMALGQPMRMALLWPNSADYAAGKSVSSGTDIFIDPVSRAVHILASSLDGTIRYFFNPNSSIPVGGLVSQQSFSGYYRSRLQYDGKSLHAILGDASQNNIDILSTASGTSVAKVINWNASTLSSVVTPITNFGGPSAIYVEGPQYQSTPVQGLNFAACGNYANGLDNDIYWFDMSLPLTGPVY